MTDFIENSLHSSGIRDAIDAGVQIGAQSVKQIEGIPHTLIPPGYTLIGHPKLLENPRRTVQRVKMITTDSFINYFNRFSSDDSVIFCNIDAAKFTGIIDYHDKSTPAWCNHIAEYTCAKTPEWVTWSKKDGIPLGQSAFAEFIEQNLEEIIQPTGAEMLEIATTLKANTNIKFTSGKRLSDGQTQFQYHEEIDGTAGQKGQFKIPDEFKLGMSVFEGGEAYEIRAKFRYRIKDGQVSLWYDLLRPHKTYRAAVDDIFLRIEQLAECHLILHGTPG